MNDEWILDGLWCADPAGGPADRAPLVLDPARIAAAPYLLLDAHRCPAPRQALEAIRQHLSPSIYLKPVLMINAQGEEAADVADARLEAAGPISVDLHQRLEAIDAEARALATGGEDPQVLLRLLRFMASRRQEFVPQPSIGTRYGYRYPLLEPLLVDQDRDGGLALLQLLEEQNLLRGRFVTRAHGCAHCGCAFLNFQETCPQCSAPDILADDLVHHFRCGYVAELRAYRRGERLVCPKCDRALRQIGVDYDKPSVMFHCQQCAHDFQEPTVMTTCYDCRRSTAPEYQLQRQIAAYSVTAVGRSAASQGLESLFMSVIEQHLKLCPWPAFEEFVAVEAARIERHPRCQSSLLMLHIDAVQDLYLRLGRRSRQVFEELAEVITSVLRRSDLISARYEGLFVALLTETDAIQAERAAERLRAGLGELLSSEIAAEAVRTGVVPVLAEEVLAERVERFTAANHVA